MSVPAGILAPSAPARPAPIPKHQSPPSTRLQEGQYESSVPTLADRVVQASLKVNIQVPGWMAVLS